MVRRRRIKEYYPFLFYCQHTFTINPTLQYSRTHPSNWGEAPISRKITIPKRTIPKWHGSFHLSDIYTLLLSYMPEWHNRLIGYLLHGIWINTV